MSMSIQPTIIIDTREQLPYAFSSGVKTVVAGLPYGDYSLAGLEQEIVIERKSLGDLLGSITRERERFERELKALRTYRLAVLMIEADWGSILTGNYRAAVSPAAVIGSLMAFVSRYGVVPVLAGDRGTAEILTERILCLEAVRIERDFKKLVA
jgi:DNA excision repair protein ERCC-4